MKMENNLVSSTIPRTPGAWSGNCWRDEWTEAMSQLIEPDESRDLCTHSQNTSKSIFGNENFHVCVLKKIYLSTSSSRATSLSVEYKQMPKQDSVGFLPDLLALPQSTNENLGQIPLNSVGLGGSPVAGTVTSPQVIEWQVPSKRSCLCVSHDLHLQALPRRTWMSCASSLGHERLGNWRI